MFCVFLAGLGALLEAAWTGGGEDTVLSSVFLRRFNRAGTVRQRAEHREGPGALPLLVRLREGAGAEALSPTSSCTSGGRHTSVGQEKGSGTVRGRQEAGGRSRFRGAHGDEDVEERKPIPGAGVTGGEGAGSGEPLIVLRAGAAR